MAGEGGIRGGGRGDGWQALAGVAMIAAAAGAFLAASGCICDDEYSFGLFDAANSVSESPPGSARLLAGGPGQCTFRYDSGPEATIFFHPPPGATVVSVTGARQAPDYAPPPWRFEGIRPGTTITVELGGVKDDDLCQWWVGVGWDEKKLRWERYDSYWSRVTASGSRGRAAATVAAGGTPISAWYLWLTFGAQSTGMDTALCQRVMDFLQEGDVVFALRYPQDPGLQAGVGWREPVAFRGDDRPLLTLTAGDEVFAELPLEYRPEWLEFARDNLPAAAGEAWTVLGPQRAPRSACQDGIDLFAWALNLQLHLDLGGRIDPYWDHVLEAYACYRGEGEPVLPGAAAVQGGESAVRAEGITCLGPVPIRLTDWFNGPDPPYGVGLGGFRRVDAGDRVEVQARVSSYTDAAVDLDLSVSSTLGIPWQLYGGDYTAPDLGSPITGPVNLPGWETRPIWLVADVPAGTQGLDTTHLTAVASGQEPAWGTYFLQVGPWTAPPEGTGWNGWVPVGSHAPGSHGSRWRADLGLLNPGVGEVSAEVRLHAPDGIHTLAVTVPPRGQAIVSDVVGAMGYSGAGALEVHAPAALEVTSRSYNQVAAGAECFPGGTLGQALDGAMVSAGLVAGQRAWIPQLVENDAFRSNVGLVNTGSAGAAVLVRLHDGAGTQLAEYTVTLAPGEWKQDNRPFANRAGRTDLDAGYAVVEVSSGAGVFAYGSVVDNLTNDPTTVPMVPELVAGTSEAWIPVAVHAAGAHGSQWRTTLGLLNPGGSQASATVRLYTASGTATATYTVPAGGQLIVDDVAGVMGVDGGGPLQVTSSRPLVVTSRTYTRIAADALCSPGGTLGQALTATVPTPVLAAGDVVRIPHLVENAAFRSNIGFADTGSSPATVRVRLHDAAGTELAVFDVTLSPHEWKQENRPFAERAGRTDLDAAWATVEVLEGEGVLVYGSVVDNVTNDPTTVVARRR